VVTVLLGVALAYIPRATFGATETKAPAVDLDNSAARAGVKAQWADEAGLRW
jgi:hypothetical protein